MITLDSVEKKILSDERLSHVEGLFLLENAPLFWLGQLAMEKKNKKFPKREVSFVLDTNPNYTNICDTDCHFCAFFRRPQEKDAYSLSVDEVMEKISTAVKNGATTVLLQGGHNFEIPFDYYLNLVKQTKLRFPSLTPHFFSASEIQAMARVSGLAVGGVLAQLYLAGQRTLPGGGAEILSDRVRKSISPKKGSSQQWLSVHQEAHRQGFLSTATMMYGHIEEPEDIVLHFDSIRSLQDESLSRKNGGGFTAFIPWSFKPDNSVLGQKMQKASPDFRPGPLEYFRILAASRLYLDNFDHIQASWFSEGKKPGQMALRFGADDFGGTIFEENVHAEAGFVNTSSIEEVVSLIHEAGFDAVQRTTAYEKVRVIPASRSVIPAKAVTVIPAKAGIQSVNHFSTEG